MRGDLLKALRVQFAISPALGDHLVLLALQLAASASGCEWLGGSHCPGISFPAVMQLLAGAPPSEWEEVREEFGGLLNTAASYFIALFAPKKIELSLGAEEDRIITLYRR